MSISAKNEIRRLALFTCAFYCFLLWMHWPAIIRHDLLYLAESISNGQTSSLYSVAYSSLLILFYQISPYMQVPLLFLIAGWSLLFYGFFTFLINRGLLRIEHARVFCFLFCFWPYLIIQNLLLDRDVFCAFFYSALTVFFLLRSATGKALLLHGWLEMIGIGIVFIYACNIRQDSLPLIILYPLALFFCANLCKLEWLSFGATIITLFVGLSCLTSMGRSPLGIDKSYAALSFINPTLDVIYHDGDKKLSELERSQLAEFVDIKWVKENPDPYDNSALYKAKIDSYKLNHEWPLFKNLCGKLIYRNIDLFFKNRYHMLVANLGLGTMYQSYFDVLEFSNDEVAGQARFYYVERTPENKARILTFANTVQFFFQNPLLKLLFSLLPIFIFAAASIYNGWRFGNLRPVIWALTFVWHRFFTIAAFSPAGQPKYLHSVAIATLFIFFFSFWEKSNRLSTTEPVVPL